MFKDFKKQFQNNFSALIQGGSQLYLTNVTKDDLWDAYINSFPEDIRQEYNCNSCRQFIKNYGNVVSLVNNQINTIWLFDCEYPFSFVGSRLDNLVRHAPIRDIFVTKQAKLGTDSNVQLGQYLDGSYTETTTWQHLYFQLPKEYVNKSSHSEDTVMSVARAIKEVFKRGLDEITTDAISTVLELIDQKSIYRGEEHKYAITEFQKLYTKYKKLKEFEKDNYCWANAFKQSEAISKIRGTSIGTLLVDISKGEDLDVAVAKFERIMAPANYKRPTTLITKRMVEDAEKTVEELGIKDALPRRFATPEDLSVNDVLFVDRDAKKAHSSDLFGTLKESIAVNPKSFSKVEEVSMADFISKIVPKANSLEVLVEDRHIPNFVSLIAPANKYAPSLFKWDNGFSWTYKDAVADSLKEKVKAAGGKVEGKLRISLEWFNYDDLDLHLVSKKHGVIYFGDKRAIPGGVLDVDENAGGRRTKTPVENIIFVSSIPEDEYEVRVNQFSQRENIDVGFNVEIEYEGNLNSYSFDKSPKTHSHQVVATFTYTRVNGFKLATPSTTSKVVSKEVWGVETQKFQKVSLITKSPNYWGNNKTGNEHLFFILDGAKNDEVARGFFNEFLKPDLEKHKRVFEALGGKMKVEPADKQLSGIGFSSTTKGEVIVKVTGTTSRTLKVKF
jgi:hypothetical protein